MNKREEKTEEKMKMEKKINVFILMEKQVPLDFLENTLWRSF